MEVVLGMVFLSFKNIDVYFNTEKLIWNNNTVAKRLPITRKVKLINKYKFAKIDLDKNCDFDCIYDCFRSCDTNSFF